MTLSGPTPTVILSRYTLSRYVFQGLEGVAGELRYTLPKGPETPTIFQVSHLKLPLECVEVQAPVAATLLPVALQWAT